MTSHPSATIATRAGEAAVAVGEEKEVDFKEVSEQEALSILKVRGTGAHLTAVPPTAVPEGCISSPFFCHPRWLVGMHAACTHCCQTLSCCGRVPRVCMHAPPSRAPTRRRRRLPPVRAGLERRRAPRV